MFRGFCQWDFECWNRKDSSSVWMLVDLALKCSEVLKHPQVMTNYSCFKVLYLFPLSPSWGYYLLSYTAPLFDVTPP